MAGFYEHNNEPLGSIKVGDSSISQATNQLKVPHISLMHTTCPTHYKLDLTALTIPGQVTGYVRFTITFFLPFLG
jgi:hypothetical protein